MAVQCTFHNCQHPFEWSCIASKLSVVVNEFSSSQWLQRGEQLTQQGLDLLACCLAHSITVEQLRVTMIGKTVAKFIARLRKIVETKSDERGQHKILIQTCLRRAEEVLHVWKTVACSNKNALHDFIPFACSKSHMHEKCTSTQSEVVHPAHSHTNHPESSDLSSTDVPITMQLQSSIASFNHEAQNTSSMVSPSTVSMDASSHVEPIAIDGSSQNVDSCDTKRTHASFVTNLQQFHSNTAFQSEHARKSAHSRALDYFFTFKKNRPSIENCAFNSGVSIAPLLDLAIDRARAGVDLKALASMCCGDMIMCRCLANVSKAQLERFEALDGGVHDIDLLWSRHVFELAEHYLETKPPNTSWHNYYRLLIKQRDEKISILGARLPKIGSKRHQAKKIDLATSARLAKKLKIPATASTDARVSLHNQVKHRTKLQSLRNEAASRMRPVFGS